jgi:hypothetical protein
MPEKPEMLPLRPYDEMNPNKMMEVAEWSKNKERKNLDPATVFTVRP